ncbi:hypothetical protein [Cellvibrio sp. OA-2007]|uniref:hypothetical protein n=1 Tax=Cellvibrio sp. OA-2007 TaxID=529823 RepID=UPI000785CACA|nr:hypothetical protein [Cellvibrio sp. OA-2007]
MNRFDKSFNGSDPITARPFSSGHPDGAWIISIVYGFILFSSSVGFFIGLYKSITGDSIQAPLIIGSLVSWLLFAPPIKLIFMRSAKALFWCLAVLGIFVLALVISLFTNADSIIPTALATIVQAYICFYLYGLLKDELIFLDSKQHPSK